MNFATLGLSLLQPPFTGASVVSFEKFLTNFLDLPALGGRQPPYIVLRLCGDLCFDKQLPEPRHCDPSFKGRPFSRSYGASLPSSLERVLSRPLVFSTNLPVSVSGTGNFYVFLKREVYELFLGA